jgi:hypothetical protein
MRRHAARCSVISPKRSREAAAFLRGHRRLGCARCRKSSMYEARAKRTPLQRRSASADVCEYCLAAAADALDAGVEDLIEVADRALLGLARGFGRGCSRGSRRAAVMVPRFGACVGAVGKAGASRQEYCDDSSPPHGCQIAIRRPGFKTLLVPRTRSSHRLAANPIANFGFKRGTRIISLVVSL